MRNSIKAALAATTGAALLLGGAGSLAYWDDSEDVPTTTVTSGELDLGAPDCDDWLLDDLSVFDPGADTIVPGDTLTRDCQFLLTLTGDHLEAEIDAALPNEQASALADELLFTADYEIDTDANNDATNELSIDPEAAPVAFDVSDDGSYLRVVLTVDFPFGVAVDNDSNGGVTAVLDAITITTTQTDSHP